TRFHTLGTLPADLVDIETAAALWETDPIEARDLLEHLSDIRLLEPAVPGCYSWHDLIGSYLRDRPGHRDAAAVRRALRQAIASAANANDRLRPGDRPHHPIVATIDADGVIFAEHSDVHAWLHPRIALLTGLARDALTSPDENQALEAAALAVNLDKLLYECCGAGHDTEELLRLITVAPLPPAADRYVGAAWHNLASGLSDQGRLAEADEAAAQAIVIWRRLGDRYGEAALLNNLSVLHGKLGDYAAALELMRQCMAAADALPDMLRSRCQVTFADLLARSGDAAAAQVALAAARALHVPEPGSIPEYHDLTAEIEVHLVAERPIEAVAAAERAVTAAREMHASQWIARSTLLLARARRLAGQHSLDTAAAGLQHLIGLHYGNVQWTCEALIELAHAHRARGDLHSADACVAEATRLADQAGLRGTPWADALFRQFVTTPQP
ncbi:tetratricopeptide repeat protein, partial [Jiangella alkaliphila]